MRACFLGQNICSLGFGIATLQAPPLVMDTPVQEQPAPDQKSVLDRPGWGNDLAPAFASPPVANPPRPVP